MVWRLSTLPRYLPRDKQAGADERQYSIGNEVLTSNSLSSSSSFACRLGSNCAMVLRVCVPQAARAGVGRVDGGFWWI